MGYLRASECVNGSKPARLKAKGKLYGYIFANEIGREEVELESETRKGATGCPSL
jgi:hypothetical protein